MPLPAEWFDGEHLIDEGLLRALNDVEFIATMTHLLPHWERMLTIDTVRRLAYRNIHEPAFAQEVRSIVRGISFGQLYGAGPEGVRLLFEFAHNPANARIFGEWNAEPSVQQVRRVDVTHFNDVQIQYASDPAPEPPPLRSRPLAPVRVDIESTLDPEALQRFMDDFWVRDRRGGIDLGDETPLPPDVPAEQRADMRWNAHQRRWVHTPAGLPPDEEDGL